MGEAYCNMICNSVRTMVWMEGNGWNNYVI